MLSKLLLSRCISGFQTGPENARNNNINKQILSSNNHHGIVSVETVLLSRFNSKRTGGKKTFSGLGGISFRIYQIKGIDNKPSNAHGCRKLIEPRLNT